MVNTKNIVWLTIYFVVLIWSAINPKDYPTWWLEVAPAIIALAIMIWFNYNTIIEKRKVNTEKEKATIEKEKANKALAAKYSNDFNNLLDRAAIILEAKGYPEEIVSQMDTLAGLYPDSLHWKKEIDFIKLKNNP